MHSNFIVCFIACLFVILLLVFFTQVDHNHINSDDNMYEYPKKDGSLIIKHHAEDGITRWHVVNLQKENNIEYVKSIMDDYYYQFMIISDPLDSSHHLDGIYKYKISDKNDKKRPEYIPRDSKEYKIVEELRKFHNCGYDLIYVSGPDDFCKYEKDKLKKSGKILTSIPRHDIFIKSSH